MYLKIGKDPEISDQARNYLAQITSQKWGVKFDFWQEKL
jgi:hypothetical protein